ncbi:MAG: putative sugar nucleotidyl transferase [Ignavibacteriaceae bacterium]|jgi:UDP-N-acetylglucosamine diphosphorylase/glucosamine-1-phosphate N-acetyltransferase|nr:putative sugar nucleotidyl transferase [Ignavibacteriaceae bacterium]
MEKILIIFEDVKYKNLLPLVYLRPVFDLRTGVFSLADKIKLSFQGYSLFYSAREYLMDNFERFTPDSDSSEILFINGRLLISESVKDRIAELNIGNGFSFGDTLIAAKIDSKTFEQINKDQEGLFDFSSFELKLDQIECTLIEYPWDLINNNMTEIGNDFNKLNRNAEYPEISDGVFLINKEKIFIGENCRISPTVVIDATDGPVIIGSNVTIMPHSAIQGPAYIGAFSTIKMHSAFYHGTNIGIWCKVGGEIENSILQSYSNKQHDGFLGHSYLGSWVNIGASTNGSDLKNNYTNVSVNIDNVPIDTKTTFFGAIIGDHSKTAINTMINTGTNIGVSCNLFGADFPPKYIPSFSWANSGILVEYKLNKAIEVAKIVMSRRNVEFTESDRIKFEKVFELTKHERN